MPIELWTDGSCDIHHPSRPIGYAALLRQVDDKGVLLKDKLFEGCAYNGTSQVAELEAVRLGLTNIRKVNQKVIVYTDSTYIMRVINNKSIKNFKSNIKMIEAIRFMALDHDVIAKKVKAHSGEKFNEEVDSSAKGSMQALRDLEDADNETEAVESFALNILWVKTNKDVVTTAGEEMTPSMMMSNANQLTFLYSENDVVSVNDMKIAEALTESHEGFDGFALWYEES